MRSMLPEVYHELLPEDFLVLNPQETLAQCSDCYKTKRHAPRPHFDSRLKCCTYFPFLPNYLLGGILSDSRHEQARETLRDFIRNRSYITPLGLTPPPAYQKKFNAKSKEDFGNDRALICPFYDESHGQCGVWRYRGHECLTYFCHSSYGEKGEEFWRHVREYLFRWEMFLSQSAYVELGAHPKWLDTNLSFLKMSTHREGEGGQLPSLLYIQLWGHAAGQEEDFFKRAFAFVKDNASRLKEEYYDEFKPAAEHHPRVLKALLLGGSV